MLMPSLETSIANSGLPTLVKAFGATFQEAQWIVLGYLLVITSLIVSVGRLGDILGRRRLLLAGVALFTLASLLCSLAPTLGLLIGARAIQGLGAAIMMALTLASVGEIVVKEKTGSVMGLLGTMSAIGTTLGPSLGGLLIAAFNWPSIFLINVPIGIVNYAILSRYLPKDQKKANDNQPKLDTLGTLILALTLAAYALAMTLGRGRFGGLNMGLLLGAAVGVGLFILHELKTSSPLIQLNMFRDAALSAGLAMSVLVSTVMMATLVVGPFHLSHALGLAPEWVGLTLSGGPLVAALTGVPAGRIVDKFGAQNMSLLGLMGIACGTFLLSVIPLRFGIVGYVSPIVLTTASYALFQAANNTQIMKGVSPERRGTISGMLSLSRNLGLITGAAVMGAVFAAGLHATDVSSADPNLVAAGMHRTFAVAAVLIVIANAIAIGSRYLSRQNSSLTKAG
jgi:EmrB/QacA subfamily drug resistance transporter